jgi:hypothetical protein
MQKHASKAKQNYEENWKTFEILQKWKSTKAS